ncbi:MAG: bifunctional glycogen debranching protein GlgX/4-alpha-glucanotransferase [Pelosinus sp.]|nr:bifunctional glycogen debranching protein GlgX/4-alpha-glucanotransferase [Pelosinus sp.]
MRHNSHMLSYRNPFGAVPTGAEICLRLEIGSGFAPLSVAVRTWKDGVGEGFTDMELLEERWDAKVYEATLMADEEPGLLWYYFIIKESDRVYYYGNNQQNLGGIGRIYFEEPPAYQITVHKKTAKTPDWFKESVMYQIFPDRFYNGNPDGRVCNPKKNSLIHAAWENKPYYIRDMDDKHIVAYDFFGGNLLGVIKKLPYLHDLGISVLYLNPIFESASNHRYDTGDYKKIDPMLGDAEIFRELCTKAKELNISIILDGVFSHTGSDSVYFNKEGSYPGLGAYQSSDSPYYKWYRFLKYPDEYESWWGIGTLPNVEEKEPSYVDFIIEGKDSVVKHWLHEGAAGWRLDVVDELPDEFVKKLYKNLKAVNPDHVLIGEVWEDASLKTSYGQRREYLWGDELDSVMNYPFRAILLGFLLGEKTAESANSALMSLYENYPRENFYAMMNLVGSHDVPRALTLLGGAPPADTLTAGQQYEFHLGEKEKELAIARMKLLSLWQMTFPGVPCIYYGDEAGLEGYKDPYNRAAYPWGRENEELLAWYKKIIKIRNQYDVFKSGAWEPLYAEGDVYAFIRRIENGRDVFDRLRPDNVAIILLNRSSSSTAALNLNVQGKCRGQLTNLLAETEMFEVKDGGRLQLELAPLTGKILLQVEQDAFSRKAGVLLHPTSLPSRYGIGDLGKEAYEFVNFLHSAKQKLWQVLPLNPVGYGESPYQCLSAFAGNHLLISLGKLVQSGLLQKEDVTGHPVYNENAVEFAAVREFKERALFKAFQRFNEQEQPADYLTFIKENALWLEDYSLYMALKKHFGGMLWTKWDAKLVRRDAAGLAYYTELLAQDIAYHKFLQFLFFSQWHKLKQYANRMGIEIIGDMPIFVSYDSSDVWAHQKLFKLDGKGCPLTVAGVPPDRFSEDGQRWGNPHYDWLEMKNDDYLWWRQRFMFLHKLVDIIRVDHFLGFENYFEIPANEETAVNGIWVKGPGAKFFAVLEKYLGKLPLIAEDLGVITPAVEDLKNSFHYPGMKVLQFGFYRELMDADIPPVYEKNAVMYTGTHDNDTLCSWYKIALEEERNMINYVLKTLGCKAPPPEEEFCWRLIEYAYQSNANTVIIPVQDLLCLGRSARMNTPGTVGGNWQWRLRKNVLGEKLIHKLTALTLKYNR